MHLDINPKKETDCHRSQADYNVYIYILFGPCPQKWPDDSKTKLQDQSSVILLLSQAVLARSGQAIAILNQYHRYRHMNLIAINHHLQVVVRLVSFCLGVGFATESHDLFGDLEATTTCRK